MQAGPVHDTQQARHEARKRVLIRGTIFGPAGAAVVWVRDISRDGASVTTHDPLPTDCDVIFKRGSLFVAAHIVRSDDSGTGIKFYRRLTDREAAAAALPVPPGQ